MGFHDKIYKLSKTNWAKLIYFLSFWGNKRRKNQIFRTQDRFGLRSHIMADQAAKAGNLSDIVPVQVPGLENPIIADNGIRPATLEKLAKLRLRPFGFLSTFHYNAMLRQKLLALYKSINKWQHSLQTTYRSYVKWQKMHGQGSQYFHT